MSTVAKPSPRKGTPQKQARGAGIVTSTPIDPLQPGPSRIETAQETPERPVSPGLVARENEKKQLSLLNNRLAVYIDHVSRLQGENERLRVSKRRFEENKTTEITSLKGSFQREIEALRTLADDEAKLRATAQAEADNLRKQIDRANGVINTLQTDFDRLSKHVNDLEKENADLKAKHQNAVIHEAQKDKELREIKKQLQEAENDRKSVTIENATIRNKLESLKDETKFIKETHDKELRQARTLTEEEITEIDGRAQARADSYLQDKIEEFRRVYEIEKRDMRNRFDDELEQRLAAFVPAAQHAELQSRIKTVTQEITQLRSDLDEKRRLLEQERDWNAQQLRQKDTQIKDANERYRDLKREFDDLLDIKDGLQKELDTYRTLLEQEESRLNISSPNVSVRSPSSILSSRKRKRLSSAFESTEGQEDIQCVFQNVGPLSVIEHDAIHGKFVVLENTSEEDMLLGGWKIVHKSGDIEATHKFPSRFRIKAKSKITLWSSDSGATHNPPSDIVLKGISFPSNDNQSGDVEVTTIIFNQEDQEMAKRISKQRRLATTTTRKFVGSRATPQRVSFAPGELFHMEGDSNAPLDDSRCSVM